VDRTGGGFSGAATEPDLLKSLSRSPVFCMLERISWRFRKKRLIMTIKNSVQKIKDAGFFGGRGGLVFRFLGAATVYIIEQIRSGVNAALFPDFSV
jgi:hypothetical protein